MSRLIEKSPQVLADRLLAEGQRRASLVLDADTGRYRVSHPLLRELAEFLEGDSRDCRNHEAIFLEASFECGTLFSAFLHRTARGQAQGGLRHWPYERLEDYLRDGLRLSLGMTRKTATAGLWWGGGKGIIARAPGSAYSEPGYRAILYRRYGEFISSLRGCYVTAEDAGTSPLDMAEVYAATRFVTCVPEEVGGSGNPSIATAAGVVCGMEAALEFREMGGLSGKTIAMQGTGNVGGAMIPLLLERGVSRIVASEISEERRTGLLDAFAGENLEVRLTRDGNHDILAEPCDILVPSALGGVIGPKSIPQIQAPIVCGPANNQLADDERDAEALVARGITYVPDYIANRMGIVHCSNEQYGFVRADEMLSRHLGRDWEFGIHQTTLRVLATAHREGVSPVAAANHLADELAEQPHPIWGTRARQIIASLEADRWPDRAR
ncbi:MAG: Glu/Leu/Phe/Val dehydrogenase [Myxococcales bacterium]|nr:Glu/Leu/Phe/Val dehydrogenase [Myxococcales bacterium]